MYTQADAQSPLRFGLSFTKDYPSSNDPFDEGGQQINVASSADGCVVVQWIVFGMPFQ